MRRLVRMGKGAGRVTRPPRRLARKPAVQELSVTPARGIKAQSRRGPVKAAVVVLLLVTAGAGIAVLWRRIGRMTVVAPAYPTPERRSGHSESSNGPGTVPATASVSPGAQSDLLAAMSQFADAAMEYLSSIRLYYQHTERAPHAMGADLLTGITTSSDRFVQANGRLLAARNAAGPTFQSAVEDFMVQVNTVVDEEADTPPASDRPERQVRDALTAAAERIRSAAAKNQSAS